MSECHGQLQEGKTNQEQKGTELGVARAAQGCSCRRRLDGGEGEVTTKMGRLDVGEPPGGLGSVGDVPERACGGERRSAMRAKCGRRARVNLRPNRWEHEHHQGQWSTPEGSAKEEELRGAPATRAVAGAGRPPWRGQPGEGEGEWVMGES